MLRERNEGFKTIKFVDISSDDYSPEDNQGLDYETVCSPSSSSRCLCFLYSFGISLFFAMYVLKSPIPFSWFCSLYFSKSQDCLKLLYMYKSSTYCDFEMS